MPAPLHPREVVLDRLLAAFRDHGYDGASLAELSAAAGLGKSSLYHSFPGGKLEMADTVLDRLDVLLATTLHARIDGPGTHSERLDAALAVLDTFYAGGRRACLLERLCASVDRRHFQTRLNRAFAALIDGFRRLAEAAGVDSDQAGLRAEDAVVRIEGALVVAAGTQDPAVFRRALDRIRADLLPA